MILESICLGHFIGVVILIGLFFLAECVIKPIIPPMPPTEEEKCGIKTIDGSKIITQMKQGDTSGVRKAQETLTQCQTA
jgi:hypothetical protein